MLFVALYSSVVILLLIKLLLNRYKYKSASRSILKISQ